MTVPLGMPPQKVRLKREPVLFVCGKCLKRATAGKAIREAIKLEIRTARRLSGRKGLFVRVSCLGVCPKQGVVVATPAMMATAEIRIVRDPDQVRALAFSPRVREDHE